MKIPVINLCDYKNQNIKGSQNDMLSSSCCAKNITELPISSANEIYFKGRLQKQFSTQDIINFLKKNGYSEENGTFSKKLDERERLNLIFSLYPKIKANYEKDKENIHYLIDDEHLYEEFFKYAYNAETACDTELEPIDIKILADFANLKNSKIGEYLKNDFDYTIFVFKLMKRNDILDRVFELSKRDPSVLSSLHQVLQNKPSLEEMKAINTYKSMAAFPINASLRGDSINDEVLNESLESAKIIDGFLDKFVVEKQIKLIRSDHLRILNLLVFENKKELLEELFNAMQNKDKEKINNICKQIESEKPIIHNKGYISTSLDKDMNGDIRWNLTVYPGVKGSFVDLINLLSPATADENEILLQRNTVFKVTDFDYDDKTDQIVIEANVYPS